ncbi:hypothetical protein PFISCL1PPCAC_5184, partial [Pristionchus fissidentatus]
MLVGFSPTCISAYSNSSLVIRPSPFVSISLKMSRSSCSLSESRFIFIYFEFANFTPHAAPEVSAVVDSKCAPGARRLNGVVGGV